MSASVILNPHLSEEQNAFFRHTLTLTHTHTHTLASIHSGIDTNTPVCLHPHTRSHLLSLLDTGSQSVSRSPFIWLRCCSAGEIKMRCRQANVEITRPTNLRPALWSPCHRMLPEPSIKVMKCNILNRHNHRAKSSLPWWHWWHIMKSNKHCSPSLSRWRIYHADNIWVPAGGAALSLPGFANNAVMVSVKGKCHFLSKVSFFTSGRSTFGRQWPFKQYCQGFCPKCTVCNFCL